MLSCSQGNYTCEDFGDELSSSGPGGRDSADAKEKNKRTGLLSCDQKWEGSQNIMMARACAAFKFVSSCGKCRDPIGRNGKEQFIGKGAICDEHQAMWRTGTPLRLLRGAPGGGSGWPDFMPKWGFRYDGIYKGKKVCGVNSVRVCM